MPADGKKLDPRLFFGRAAVAMGLVTPQQVADCLDLQRRLSQVGGAIPLGKIMLAKGYLTAFQIQETLKAQSRHAVMCASCGAEFAVGKSTAIGGGPVRCPRCLRKLSASVQTVAAPAPECLSACGPAQAGGPAPRGLTRERDVPPVPPGPESCLHVAPPDGPSFDASVPPGVAVVIGRDTHHGGNSAGVRRTAEPPERSEGASRCPGVARQRQTLCHVPRASLAPLLCLRGEFLAVDDAALSHRHCAVSNENGTLGVEDLGSRNGTYVNGDRVEREVLRPGDEIEIGETRVFVHALGVRAPGAPDRGVLSTTELWRAEGLCALCGKVVSADELARDRAQRTERGVICPKCLEVALVPGRTLGGYRIIEQIGRGGMAEVYRAEEAASHRIVALKTLLNAQNASADARSRFVREARASASLEHPNLVRIYDAGEESGIPYIGMEYIEGDDLAVILDKHGRLDAARAVGIAIDIASALAYAHAHGVVHRDVKPGNIILDMTYGRARLLDLGVAKVHDPDVRRVHGDRTERPGLDEQSRLTRVGVGLGTLDYAAPEQIESARDVDARADVYSLGATLFRAVTGKRPFTGERELDVARAVRYEPLAWPEGSERYVPRPLREVVERAMRKKPKQRYPRALDLRAALAAVREAMG